MFPFPYGKYSSTVLISNYKINFFFGDETWLEAMMLSDPTDCIICDGTCILHGGRRMLQIFSLKLAKRMLA
jgi:hypothetical protein